MYIGTIKLIGGNCMEENLLDDRKVMGLYMKRSEKKTTSYRK